MCFAEGMTLEDQVCSLELAKKLKRMGVEQRSLWYWCKLTNGSGELRWNEDNSLLTTVYFSAFTVSELGQMLRKGMTRSYHPAGGSDKLDLCCTYLVGEGKGIAGQKTVSQHRATEADARGAVLAHLIEGGLLTLPKSVGAVSSPPRPASQRWQETP